MHLMKQCGGMPAFPLMADSKLSFGHASVPSSSLGGFRGLRPETWEAFCCNGANGQGDSPDMPGCQVAITILTSV
uniref:Uncharacterized protein n=1 Tax=Sphaerodactylus townsendi TaxID=933632 RepID=A0ACB8FTA5_9SAUR